MSGIAHPYYAVAHRPGGGGAHRCRASPSSGGCDRRTRWPGSSSAPCSSGTAWWGLQVLDRTPDFLPGVGIGALFVATGGRHRAGGAVRSGRRRGRAWSREAPSSWGWRGALFGPAIYTGATMGRPIAGGDPAAGRGASVRRSPGTRSGSGGLPGRARRLPGGRRRHERCARGLPGRSPWRRHLARRGLLRQPGRAAPARDRRARDGDGRLHGIRSRAPTLEQLQAYVADGRLRFVLLGRTGTGVRAGSSAAMGRAAWPASGPRGSRRHARRSTSPDAYPRRSTTAPGPADPAERTSLAVRRALSGVSHRRRARCRGMSSTPTVRPRPVPLPRSVGRPSAGTSSRSWSRTASSSS